MSCRSSTNQGMSGSSFLLLMRVMLTAHGAKCPAVTDMSFSGPCPGATTTVVTCRHSANFCVAKCLRLLRLSPALQVVLGHPDDITRTQTSMPTLTAPLPSPSISCPVCPVATLGTDKFVSSISTFAHQAELLLFMSSHSTLSPE